MLSKMSRISLQRCIFTFLASLITSITICKYVNDYFLESSKRGTSNRKNEFLEIALKTGRGNGNQDIPHIQKICGSSSVCYLDSEVSSPKYWISSINACSESNIASSGILLSGFLRKAVLS